ncbi:MAG: 4-hydroxy-tetrahydrodipicolinate synthase [Methylobacteriaceae bacterium]|jgi:4-hydroxy-tetrahydrodipicolinate synthase|nr:4-hydroxy-tetrahydrodipicolinate synthase [Methylobacteriaceae bacterium]
MQSNHSVPSGLWLPLITPFRDGVLDEKSLRRLLKHYAAEPVDGFVLGATTGEGLTLDEDEVERLVAVAAVEIARSSRRRPIFLGLSGSNTRKGIAELARTAAWPIDGYLITCPYYTRPSQQGLYHHFAALADATARPILLYNIPYRTGVNLSNEVTLQLAEHSNIVGIKDCSADPIQSFDLLRSRPAGFAVLTGEDTLFYGALMQGADGGILAAAHVETAGFAFVRGRLLAGDQRGALAAWLRLFDLARLLFAEPNPAPIKHWLWRARLIDSPEVRLPMTPVSDTLAARIGLALAQASRAAACA